MTATTSHDLFDLESPIRDLDNLASLTMQWALERTFHRPDSTEDDVTNQLRAREVDHLLFALAAIGWVLLHNN